MDLRKLALEKIEYGDNLMSSLSQFNGIEGIQKLHKKIKQELNFLKKVRLWRSLIKPIFKCYTLF